MLLNQQFHVSYNVDCFHIILVFIWYYMFYYHMFLYYMFWYAIICFQDVNWWCEVSWWLQRGLAIGLMLAPRYALRGLPLERWLLYKSWRPKGVFQFEIIINVLFSFFWFIWIPMWWVYNQYKFVYSHSAGIDFKRQNLTSIDVRFWRLKSILAL